MSFSIELTAGFERQFKKLIKKYPSLKEEIIALRKDFLLNPQTGTPIGKDCYKIRIAIHSKGKVKAAAQELLCTFMFQLKGFSC